MTTPTTFEEHATCPERYRRPAPHPRPSAPPGAGLPFIGGGRVRDMAVGVRARVAALHLYQDTFGKLWVGGAAFVNGDYDDDFGLRDVRVERVPAGLRVLAYNPETVGRSIKVQNPYDDDVWVVEFPDPDIPVVEP